LIGLLFILFACSDDAVVQVLPLSDNITEVNAYDLDNNNNGSDIRVDFEVSSNLNVSEYRVMILPSSSSNSFTEESALSVPQESYFSVSPQTDVLEYSINRLPANLLDVTGNQISNGIDYEVILFVIGTENQRISSKFADIIINDQGIYEGIYHTLECPPFQDPCAASVSSVVNQFYTGIFSSPPFIAGALSSEFFFKLGAEDTLLDFEWISHFSNPAFDCTETVTGAGKVEDELLLKFDFSGLGYSVLNGTEGESPCDTSTVSGILELIRQ